MTLCSYRTRKPAKLRRSQKLFPAVQEEAAHTFSKRILAIAEAGTRQSGTDLLLSLTGLEVPTTPLGPEDEVRGA